MTRTLAAGSGGASCFDWLTIPPQAGGTPTPMLAWASGLRAAPRGQRTLRAIVVGWREAA